MNPISIYKLNEVGRLLQINSLKKRGFFIILPAEDVYFIF